MQLRAVVAGDEDLTPQCRSRAAEAVAWAADVARQRFVGDVIGQWLAQQGYDAVGELDFQNSGELRLTRPEWHSEHCVEIWLDRNGVVHGRLVPESQPHAGLFGVPGPERGLIERSRYDAFSADLEVLGRLLCSEVVADAGHLPPPNPVGASRGPASWPQDYVSEA